MNNTRNLPPGNESSWLPSGRTQLLGVIGDPIRHSLSPLMHNTALHALGLDYCYLPFHVKPEMLTQAVRGFQAMGMLGFNATIPHKEALLPLMDWLTPLAERIGAVNTVAIDATGSLRGYNTDAQGFTDDLCYRWPMAINGWQVLMLGAGGAARGVAVGLLEAGVKKLTVANRTGHRAKQLMDALAPFYPQAEIQAVPLNGDQLPLEQIQLLVNTTSIGLRGEEENPIPLARLPDSARVYDIVYSPPQTPLLRAAKARGLQTANGLGMLVFQGARSFEIWTGQKMPVDRVYQRLANLANPR